MAKKLSAGAPDDEQPKSSSSSTPRAAGTTPRTPRSSQTNGIKKPANSGKRGSAVKKDAKSPTKAGKYSAAKGEALINAIRLSDTDSDGGEETRSVKSETVPCEDDKMVGVKVEYEKLGVPVDFGLKVNSQTNGYVQPQDDDDVFGEDA